jgi:hypothetical protein
MSIRLTTAHQLDISCLQRIDLEYAFDFEFLGNGITRAREAAASRVKTMLKETLK